MSEFKLGERFGSSWVSTSTCSNSEFIYATNARTTNSAYSPTHDRSSCFSVDAHRSTSNVARTHVSQNCSGQRGTRCQGENPAATVRRWTRWMCVCDCGWSSSYVRPVVVSAAVDRRHLRYVLAYEKGESPRTASLGESGTISFLFGTLTSFSSSSSCFFFFFFFFFLTIGANVTSSSKCQQPLPSPPRSVRSKSTTSGTLFSPTVTWSTSSYVTFQGVT